MSIANILSDIDAEISRLEQAKQLLVGTTTVKRGPGRPPRNSVAVSVAPQKRARRKLSAAGRARIAAAQKARWAKIRKTSGKATPAKAESTK